MRRLSLNLKRLPILFIGVLVLLTSVPLSSVAAATAVPIISVGHGGSSSSWESTNWSGYAVTGSTGSITIAQASWVVPTVTCGVGEKSYSSIWVGIDGFSSSTVEQTGTDSDCSHGTPTYHAWFEFYPKPSSNIGSIVVHPGDVIGARVWYTGGIFRVAIADFTTAKLFTTGSAVSGAARSSAEFIVEAPESCILIRCTLTSLSNFGTAGFGGDNTGLSPGSLGKSAAVNCAVAEGGALAPIGSFGSAVQEITMVSQSSTSVVKAQPSALSDDGTSFTVQWMSAGP
jgi:Peptidase A4 family